MTVDLPIEHMDWRDLEPIRAANPAVSYSDHGLKCRVVVHVGDEVLHDRLFVPIDVARERELDAGMFLTALVDHVRATFGPGRLAVGPDAFHYHPEPKPEPAQVGQTGKAKAAT